MLPANRRKPKPAGQDADREEGKQSRASAYQLRVTLLETHPPIWRRIVVPPNASAEFLHSVIQTSMGWTDSHLHQFILGKRPNYVYVGLPDPDFERDVPTLDSSHFTIRELMARSGGKVAYEYDFGDSWEHEVRLEREIPVEPGMQLPACLDGARACPPEDCGGVGGYEDIVKMLQDPKFEPRNGPRDELMQWVGPDFDPEAFDVGIVNALLSPTLRKRGRSK